MGGGIKVCNKILYSVFLFCLPEIMEEMQKDFSFL
jgi:hypothetical protein